MKHLTLIANMDQNRLIGNTNGLPWKGMSADLKRFRKLTTGNPVVMGRKTFEAIGRVLPDRPNHVVSREHFSKFKPETVPEGLHVWSSLPQAIVRIDAPELMIIGGGQIYEQTIKYATRFHLSVIPRKFDTDANAIYFPEFVALGWTLHHHEFIQADADNKFPHHYFSLERSAADHLSGNLHFREAFGLL